MKKTIAFIFFILFVSTIVFSQKQDSILIRGKILKNGTKEPVEFSSIYIKHTKKGVIANEQGKFEIKIDSTNLKDTIVVSSIGYKTFVKPIIDIKHRKNFIVNLQDSLFLLKEVTALCYDRIDALYWVTEKKTKKKLLTFATRNKTNALNFITFLKEEFGPIKLRHNQIVWKKASIKKLKLSKLRITLNYFRCTYCPEDNNINVTLEIKGKHGKNLLDNEQQKEQLRKFFQAILDKTFAQGIDNDQLVRKGNMYYLENTDEPYTGKCYKFYKKSGNKGFKGQYKNGLKTGLWEFWYDNGKQKLIGTYKNGVKTGNWKYWYRNGNLRIDSNYKDGRLVDTNTWYYENGQKKKVAIYKNGVFQTKIEWDEKGNIVDRIDMRK